MCTTDVLIRKWRLKLSWRPYLTYLVVFGNCPDDDALLDTADVEFFNFESLDDLNTLLPNTGDGAAQGGDKVNYEPPTFFPFREMPQALKPRPSNFPTLRKVAR